VATPIGSGPNGIALGIVNQDVQVTFLQWMLFALPLTFGMLALSFVLLRWLHRVRGRIDLPQIEITPLSVRGYAVIVLFGGTVLLWLLEPIHKQPAALIAFAAAAVLFGSRLLKKEDLAEINWSTLILIAGGLTLGELIDRSGLATILSRSVAWQTLPDAFMLFCFVFAVAFLSAIASNTAAAALLIPIALGVHHAPHIAILIAIGASLGAPFVISTPPNALAYGEGGLKSGDFLLPGVILMIIGCIIVSLTGPAVLRWAAIP
jgi:sodium-dependent dicarboxylate transporter 2/3/5